ncbi:2-oxo acid dehydrogenase subunit E2 [Buchnera aphidicola (Ceratovacuna keduensis)]|uniref:2-oxo acid dehydrogenase subunit E2 n=1 Tax=Buchnera aphidicola TaxID=9 RepID=UPI0031B80FB0
MYKTVRIPDIGKEKLEVIEILVKIGDFVKNDQNLLIVEGEKTSIEIPSKETGKIKKIFIKIGDLVKTNSKIFLLKKKEIKKEKKINKNNILKIDKRNDIPYKDYEIYASPMIRRLARKNSISLSKIKGTGNKGRISKEDFFAYLEKKDNNYNKNNLNNIFKKNFCFEKFGKIKKISLNKIQKVISKNLLKSWLTIPHVTQFDEINITKLEKFRKNVNLDILNNKNNSIKITLLPFVVKAIANALKNFPNFNSSYSEESNTLFLKKYINIGIVINCDRGIFIPVIKDVFNKSIFEISIEISYFSEKVRSNSLKKEDMEGGNFTISNLGGYGGGYFTPIINFPEVAILGISKYINKNVFINKKSFNIITLPISLSYDHRVINGVEAVEFINFIKNKLEKFHSFIIK